MPRFTIVEAQEVTETRIYTWIIDAESPADAIDRFRDADGELTTPEPRIIGDPQFGESFPVVVLNDDRDAAIDQALANMEGE